MSTDRDNDLDRLMRELRREDPYIEKPDEVAVDVGGACFLDRDRVCGPDCTAFTDPKAPTAIERCIVLSSLDSGLGLLERFVQLRRKPSAPHIDPPDVFGQRGR